MNRAFGLTVVPEIWVAVLLQAGICSAANFTWTGAASTDWFNTNNWAPPGLPATNDTAVFTNGTINFTAPVIFSGQFNWSGGTLTGQPLTITTNGVLNISGNNTKILSNALTNAGTAIWAGNGGLEVDYSSAINAYGYIENLAGALWDIQSSQNLYNNYNNGAYFQNAGTVRKSATTGTTTISIPFYNSGLVTDVVGGITFSKGGIIGGAFSAAAGTTITFSTGAFSYTTEPTVTGLGTVQLIGGNLTLVNDAIANLRLVSGTVNLGPNFQGGGITNLTLLGGTLNGDNTVRGTFNWAATLSGSLTVLSGGTANWSSGYALGAVTIASNGVLNISGNNTKFLWGPLTNAGTVTLSGAGGLEVDYSSTDSFYGLIQNLVGGLWDIQNDGNLFNAYNNGAYFRNAGTVRKSAGTGTTTISLPVYNSGSVTALAGILAFSKGGVIEGSFGATTGATINFNSGSFSYTAPPSITGAGAVQLNGGNLTLLNDAIPNLQIVAGMVSLGSNFQGGSITNLTLLGGTLNGNLVVSGTFNWAGTLSGSLTVRSGGVVNWSGGYTQNPITIASNGVLNISGNGPKFLWNALTNAGTVTWTGNGNLQVDYSSATTNYGLIQNLAGALWDIQNNQNIQNTYNNGAYFQNFGTVRKSAGIGASTISIPFYNAGIVAALMGTIAFNNGAIIEGTFSAAVGATINFNTGVFSYTTPPTVTGGGSVQLNGGSLTLANNTIANLRFVAGTVSLGPNFQGGSITNLTLLASTLNGDNVVSGTFNWAGNLPGSLRVLSGGTANWSGGRAYGPITIAANGVLNISGDTTKYLWNALTNAGTVTWTGNGWLEVDYSTSVTNYGLIQNLAGGLWDIQNSQTINNTYRNGAYFQNAGMVRKSADAGTTTVSIPFYNSGAVTSLIGSIVLNNGATIEGSFNAAAAASINFKSGSFSYGTPPAVTGTGNVQLTGGSLTLVNDAIANLQLAGGTVSLAANFQGGTITNLTVLGGTLTGNNLVSGTFNWTGSLPGSLAVLSGATVNWNGGTAQGPLTIASNGVLNITGNLNKLLWNGLTNSGTVTWSGFGNLEVDYSTTVTNFGLIENLAGGLWDIQNDQILYNSYSTRAYFRNAGTVRKSGGTQTTSISIPFTNSGTAMALQKNLAFNGGFTPGTGTLVVGLGSLANPGQFNISGNAMLDGTLNVVWLGGYVPALSNSFTLVSYGSHTGTFPSLNLPPAANWQVNYGATALTVLVTDVKKLVITSPTPGDTNAGGILSAVTVQVRDAAGNSVATNGLAITIALASGSGVLSGTVTRNTDATGKATFDDLSVNLVGVKTLMVSAPGMTPATTATFNITPAAAAQLALVTSIGATQRDEAVFTPAPVVQVRDQFGNVVPSATNAITARLSSGGGGALGGTLSVNASGTSGSAAFTNLVYGLANHLASESAVVYFSSPGLVSVTNSAVLVNFVFGVITLQSGNSLVQINAGTKDGIFSWKVDGSEQLFQQWFWLRQGSTGGQASLDTLGPPVGVSVSSSNATVNYRNTVLNVNVTFSLKGGAAASLASDLMQSLSVQNTSNGPVTLHLFQYSDYDLAGEANGDTVSFPSANKVAQQGKGMAMTETVQSPVPSFWEASYYAITFDEITGNSPATLSNQIIPPSPGDQTFGLQWDATLPAGQVLLLVLTNSIRKVSGPALLSIAPVGDGVIISWPTNGTAGYRLESARVGDTGLAWSEVSNSPAVVGEYYQVIVAQRDGGQLYRLKQ